jgi:aldose 1-epimerase
MIKGSLKERIEAGLASDGQPAKVVELKNSQGMTATFMDIGATWLSATMPVKGQARELLLGVGSVDDYYNHGGCLGSTVGRYANRIKQGQLTIDGETFSLPTNAAGNTLHGGSDGFHKRRWTIEKQTEDKVQFTLVSEDGDQGFPGEVAVLLTYELTELNQVQIHFRAVSTKSTVVNLTNHAYFDLSGGTAEDCLTHSLMVNAPQFLPSDDTGIPFGDLLDVDGTSFDFRTLKPIGHSFKSDEHQVRANGYDHSFLLDRECMSGEVAAELVSPQGDLSMKVFTTKPAIQVYTGNFLAGSPKREGGEYHNYAGVALETQYMPDSPNHPEWPQPDVVLREEEEYMQSTVYQFEEI